MTPTLTPTLIEWHVIEVDIQFNPDRIVSSTMPSHCLVQWVSAYHGLHKSEELYAVLNRMHFVEGRALNDLNLLASACDEIGLDGAAAKAFLETDGGRDSVKKMTQRVAQLGIHSIPTLVIAGRHLVSGAERAETFVRLFRDIEESMLATGEAIPHETAIALDYQLNATL